MFEIFNFSKKNLVCLFPRDLSEFVCFKVLKNEQKTRFDIFSWETDKLSKIFSKIGKV